MTLRVGKAHRQRWHGRRLPESQRATGGCPVCGRDVARRANGSVYAHNAPDGGACTGHLVPDPDRTFTISELPPVVMPERRKPATRRRSYGRANANSDTCPVCGRRTKQNGDGTLRAHRPSADMYVGPYCPGGRERGPQ